MSWRLGATSYVYRGDLLHNLTLLAGQVWDVELVLFDDGAGYSNFPTPQQVHDLHAFLADRDMSVTVHLPADAGGAIDAEQRQRALVLNHRAVELTAPLRPHAWIVHVETEGAGTPHWRDAAIADLDTLCQSIGNPTLLALENLESYAPELLEPVFAALPLSRTLDIGHLWKQGRAALPIVEAWLPYARVAHLHGVHWQQGGPIDHASLHLLDDPRLQEMERILSLLENWTGVLTLEVFEEDYFTSRAVLDAALARVATVGLRHVA